VIAASATISNPAAHLEALTGLRFETVGEELDGSPRHPRQLIHVASKRNDEAMIAAALQKRLLIPAALAFDSAGLRKQALV
jgi:ATP-dependent helicase YprA (DUF1998 family)